MIANKYPKIQRDPKVCIIGAGFSGLCAAIQLKRKLKLDTFTIYESRYDIGGTWLVNSYPGCACDIQSHLYSFSFEPNPYWSSNYPPQKEIWTYQKTVAEKYNLYPHINFNTEVKSAIWDEDLRKWRVTISEKSNSSTINIEKEISYDIVINACGSLRVPNIPQEFLHFKGLMTHSGDWNPSILFDETKTVAVVGTGASATQIVPAIAEKVKTLHIYQRKAPWIIPCTQYSFSENVQTLFLYFPFIMWIFRCLIFLFNEIHYSALHVNTTLNKIAPFKIKFNMKKQLPNKERLFEELIPDYPFGCNKVVLSSDYYPALTLPHVHVHSSPITKVTKDSILNENGESQKIDILILATGFKPQDYFSPMQIIGTKGDDILNAWKVEGPKIYLGITCHSTPNLFTIYGPNTSPGHNSILFMIECQVNFVISLLKEMRRRKSKVAQVKLSAQERYMAKLHKKLKTTTWANHNCGAWYKNGQDIVTTHWPQSCISYWRQTKKIDRSKFDFY